MPGCLSTVGKAGPTGRLSVCLVVLGLVLVIQGTIFMSFSSFNTYQFVLIGVGGTVLLIGLSVCMYAYVKGSNQSSNQPPFVVQVN